MLILILCYKPLQYCEYHAFSNETEAQFKLGYQPISVVLTLA